MGTLKNGVFGGFSGKVGPVVGASWKDIDYIRALPTRVNDPKTKRQVKQRSRFSVVMDFLRTITPFIRVGFQPQANGRMTAFNAAMSHNMKFAVKGEHQEMELDYSNVLVSCGSLDATADVHAEIVERELQVDWETGRAGNTRWDDMAMVLACNPAKRESVYDLNAGKREAMKAVLPLPRDWEGYTIETYLAFKTADGSMVSDSVYTGRLAISGSL